METAAGFEDAVTAVLRGLVAGEVVTYGEVAAEAGFPGAARAVGNLLAQQGGDLPWWRVVTANGRLVPGHEREHARRLGAEGVLVVDGRVARPPRSSRSSRSPGSPGSPPPVVADVPTRHTGGRAQQGPVGRR